MSIQIKIVEIFSSPINAYFVNLLKFVKLITVALTKLLLLNFQ